MYEINAYVVTKFAGADKFVYNGEYIFDRDNSTFDFAPRSYVTEHVEFDELFKVLSMKIGHSIFSSLDSDVVGDICDMLSMDETHSPIKFYDRVALVSLDALETACCLLEQLESNLNKLYSEMLDVIQDIVATANDRSYWDMDCETKVVLVFF